MTPATKQNSGTIESIADHAETSSVTPENASTPAAKKCFSPEDIRPYPKAKPRKENRTGSKRGKSMIAISTPEMKRIEEEYQNRQLKRKNIEDRKLNVVTKKNLFPALKIVSKKKFAKPGLLKKKRVQFKKKIESENKASSILNSSTDESEAVPMINYDDVEDDIESPVQKQLCLTVDSDDSDIVEEELRDKK